VAANEYSAALNGNLQPKWIESRSHAGLGRVFELTGQHECAVNEFWQAAQTDDNVAHAQDVVDALAQSGKPADPPITTPASMTVTIELDFARPAPRRRASSDARP